jgi:hypothetical protein
MGGEFFVSFSDDVSVNEFEWTKAVELLLERCNQFVCPKNSILTIDTRACAEYALSFICYNNGVEKHMKIKPHWDGNKSIDQCMSGRHNILTEQKKFASDVLQEFIRLLPPKSLALNICDGFSGGDDDCDIYFDGSSEDFLPLDFTKWPWVTSKQQTDYSLSV